jgi:homeobox protein cut-like
MFELIKAPRTISKSLSNSWNRISLQPCFALGADTDQFCSVLLRFRPVAVLCARVLCEIKDFLLNIMDSALTAWKAFDLSESQKLVDEQALQMVDNDQTSNERKLALLEKTKAYGLLPVEEKIQSVLPLLKAYQGEITSLTKRAKFSESSFLHIFKALSILPDPVVYLEQGLSDSHRILNFEAEKVKDSHRISFLESENVDLKNLLEQYANELKASKYMEAGLRSLEERNKELEHKVQQFSSRQIHEQKLTTELVELSHNYAEKEGLLLTQLDNIKGTLTSTIVGHQIKEKEYFQTIQTIESKRAAKDAEADHLAGELDRLII